MQIKANKKKLIIRVFISLIISIFIIVLILSFLPRPKLKQQLYIGDTISGYRIMNRWNSFSCLTSLKQIDEEKYEIKFIQYYDNNPYEFTYVISNGDNISLYPSKISKKKKNKIKITINSSEKTLLLEKEE